ncbi:hypothetical protein DV515_00018138 [Chloebia gouldiae]|uniref:ribonuclease H n=1 Tax=Chloebia gouldiae TaxID=44316 RepID=A0A3L8Q8C7_CHLGU|nr:hypothetical protein DV515_00018138 [Chloebia gouldiae]
MIAPLREAMGPQGGRVLIKVPFSPGDLVIWKQSAGSYREDPERVARVVKMVIKTQNPDWNDLQVLLDTIMDSTEKEMVLRATKERAREEIKLRRNREQGYEGTVGELVPSDDPEWNPNSADGYRAIRKYQELLVEGVRTGMPKTLNWSKLYSVRQEKNESPSAFLERLKETARRYTNLEIDEEPGQLQLALLFMGQSQEDIRKKLQKLEGDDTRKVDKMLEVAWKVYNNREKETAKRQQAGILAIIQQTTGQGGGQQGRGRVRGRGRGFGFGKGGFQGQGLMGMNNGRQTGLGPNQCAFCRQLGHWKNECPPLFGRDLLSLLNAKILFEGGRVKLEIPDEEIGKIFVIQEVDPTPIPDEISNVVVPWVWETGTPGKSKAAQPVVIELKEGAKPVRIKQYPIKLEARRGVAPVIAQFVIQGLLKECESEYNTPIFPVRKPNGKYRLVQDLRAINEIVKDIHPVVANPYTLLTSVSEQFEWFTVIDLKDAFFCIPLAIESIKYFAFEWEDPATGRKKQLTWTRLPQGFKNSPTIFGNQLARELEEWKTTQVKEPPASYTILQYVDDILLATQDRGTCVNLTIALLNMLGQAGYRVSKEKAQLYQAILREQDDVQLQTTSHLNPAEFLRSKVTEDELVHDCVEMIEQVYSSRQDLKDEPLDTADWELFTDGSSFVKNGTRILNALRGALQWNRPLSLENPIHNVQPGDQVYVKNWSTDPLRESWSGPHQVILTTYTAVKVAGMDSWIHYTRIKKAPTQWVSQAVTPTRLILRANYS